MDVTDRPTAHPFFDAAAERAARATGPMVGVVATLLGTLGAMMLFPERPSPRGALVAPAAVLSVSILLVPFMRAISGSAAKMNAENFVALGFIYWLLLDLVQGAYDLSDASNEALRLALIAVGLSAAAMWLGAAARPWRVPRGLMTLASTALDSRMAWRLVPICFAIGMFNYAYAVDFDIPVMFSYIGMNRWEVPWARGQLGGWGSFIDQLPYFGYVLPSLTAVLLVRRGFSVTTLLSVAMSVVMLVFLAQGGGRRIIGVTCGAALIVWVQLQPKLNVRKVLTIGVAVIALLWLMQFMLNIRTVGYAEFALRGQSEYDYLHVDDNFLRLAQVIEIVPAEHDYVYGQQLVFAAVRPIPRVFWPNKPVDPGFDLPTEVGLRGVSLSTSIIGEWYLSFGWIGVLVGGWLHGRLSNAANALRYAGSHNPIVFALTVMVLVSGMRSMQDLVIMSYALVAWWAVNRFMNRRAGHA